MSGQPPDVAWANPAASYTTRPSSAKTCAGSSVATVHGSIVEVGAVGEISRHQDSSRDDRRFRIENAKCLSEFRIGNKHECNTGRFHPSPSERSNSSPHRRDNTGSGHHPKWMNLCRAAGQADVGQSLLSGLFETVESDETTCLPTFVRPHMRSLRLSLHLAHRQSETASALSVYCRAHRSVALGGAQFNKPASGE